MGFVKFREYKEVAFLLVGFGGAAMAFAAGEEPVANSIFPRIVNGRLTQDYPAVGAIIQRQSGLASGGELQCTGTLIGCQTVLTAAHCVEDDRSPASYQLFFQNAGLFAVRRISVHPRYRTATFPAADVAVLTLDREVVGIPPASINAIAKPEFGLPGTIVGFGRSTGFSRDYGLKRTGGIVTDSCVDAGISDRASVCWRFDPMLGDSESNTCNGDSGGPLFVAFSGRDVIAGITSGGSSNGCSPGDVSYDSDVYSYRRFIQRAAGNDLNRTSCGRLAQIDEPASSSQAFDGELEGSNAEAEHVFAVPEGVAELRAVLNGKDDGGTNFDLTIRHGQSPSAVDYDCRSVRPGPYDACVLKPAAGLWYAHVAQQRGSGPYQLTVSQFGAALCQEPRQNCARPSRRAGSTLSIANPVDASRVRLSWAWEGDGLRNTASFSDPTTAVEYGICVFGETATTNYPVVDARLPVGAAWSKSAKGYSYSDPTGSRHGIRSVVLEEAEDSRRIEISAQGNNLRVDAPNLAGYSSLLVQWVASDERCWEAEFTPNSLRSRRVSAKSR